MFFMKLLYVLVNFDLIQPLFTMMIYLLSQEEHYSMIECLDLMFILYLSFYLGQKDLNLMKLIH